MKIYLDLRSPWLKSCCNSPIIIYVNMKEFLYCFSRKQAREMLANEIHIKEFNGCNGGKNRVASELQKFRLRKHLLLKKNQI